MNKGLTIAFGVLIGMLVFVSYMLGKEAGLAECRIVFTHGQSKVSGFRTNAQIEVDAGAELWFGPAYMRFEGETKIEACEKIRVLRAIAGNPVVTCERMKDDAQAGH